MRRGVTELLLRQRVNEREYAKCVIYIYMVGYRHSISPKGISLEAGIFGFQYDMYNFCLRRD